MGGFRWLVSDRWAIAVTGAVLLASTTLLPLTTDAGYLLLSSIGVVVLGIVSLVLRRLQIPESAVVVIQMVILAGYTFAISLGVSSQGEGNPFTRYGDLMVQATRHMQTQAPPMSPDPGVRLLFVTAVGVIMILTDVMVQGIDRPTWSLAPLASLFLVPALALNSDVPIWCFLAIAVGYLGILLADGINTSERWPRGVRKSEHDRGSAPLAIRLAAMAGIPAIVLTLGLGLIIPTLSSEGWGLTRPTGSEGPLQLADPTLDLRRNLNQPSDRVVMNYRTDQPDGSYLRMASLPVFNNAGWQNTAMQLSTGSSLPPPPGHVTQPGQVERTTNIQVADFRSEYLPLPFAPASFQAPGEWAYDPNSLVVLATGPGDRSQATEGLTYSVTSIDIEPDGAGLSSAAASNPPDGNLTAAIPQDLPDDIINLSLEVTASAPTPALKAAAIQKYLRTDGGFAYSTAPMPGSGYEALQNFLFRDKEGYCEQFAASMAVMARIAGIPSRVAVGFLPGERSGDGYEVTVRDMHAWPELWFEGYGWVRFEPTPGVASPPAWTVQGDTPGEGAGESPTPVPGETVAPTEEPTPTPPPTIAPQIPQDEPTFPWQQLLLTAGLVIAAGILATGPMLLRTRRRAQRLDGHGEPAEQVELAWAEVRDSVLDYGREWPAGSPRAIGIQLAHDLEGTASKAASVLSLMVERARYARTHSVDADLGAVTEAIREGLKSGSDTTDRILATWWPRSGWVRLADRLQR